MADLHIEKPKVIDPNYRWYRELTRYHWFVLIVAALGWMFDCLDQQLFNLARMPAMRDLVPGASPGELDKYGAFATAVFLIGWATGGILFGILGDKMGRTKTMMLTILVYSFFTGFSALSVSVYDFALYRFLTGLGVGGEFAVGVALVAEAMPDRARPFALGLLQALSAVGNVSAALISMSLGKLEETGVIGSMHFFGIQLTAWRVMFMIGTLPALLAIVIRMRLKEPERWQAAAHTEEQGKKELGSFRELFGDPRWRKRALVGMVLASAGVIGLWGIGFFSIDLNRSVFRSHYSQQARERGDAAADQRFVQLAVQFPDQIAARLPVTKDGKETKLLGFGSNDLIGPADAPRDATIAFQTLLDLNAAQNPKAPKPINAEAIKQAAAAKGLSGENLARLDSYLSSSKPGTLAELQAEAERIDQRARGINGNLSWWAGITSLMLNVGAFFGMGAFTWITSRIGRRPAFAIAFIAAALSTALVFGFMSPRTVTIGGTQLFVDVFWMIPLMGFCQLAIFGGYAIYFPELFPTRLRSTGTSFCYNVGRFVAASGPVGLGLLTSSVFVNTAEPIRWAGLSMCSIFLVGLLALPFAPETRGQPLPE